MEIKKSLKALDIKISKLANGLGVSRPTLDNYIEMFEKGEKLPNSVYQNVFEYLFSDENMNSVEFAQKYDYVKQVMLKDAVSKAKTDASAKRAVGLQERIVEMVRSGNCSKELLEFVNLFMSNTDLDLIKAIYMYFNFTNGFSNISSEDPSEKDKALFATLSKVFQQYKDGTLAMDDDAYREFMSKNQIAVMKRDSKIKDEDIINYIKSNISSAGNIDFDLLKKMLESREEK